jgi:hypothetical protein
LYKKTGDKPFLVIQGARIIHPDFQEQGESENITNKKKEGYPPGDSLLRLFYGDYISKGGDYLPCLLSFLCFLGDVQKADTQRPFYLNPDVVFRDEISFLDLLDQELFFLRSGRGRLASCAPGGSSQVCWQFRAFGSRSSSAA